MNKYISAVADCLVMARKIKMQQPLSINNAKIIINANKLWLIEAPDKVLLAKYALVAFLDEIALSTPEYMDEWSKNPLQLQLFGDNKAGESFFLNLDKMRYDVYTNLELLELYLLVLQLGFKGKYLLNNQDELRALVVSVHAQIVNAKKEKNSLYVKDMLDSCDLSPYQRVKYSYLKFYSIWGLTMVLISYAICYVSL